MGKRFEQALHLLHNDKRLHKWQKAHKKMFNISHSVQFSRSVTSDSLRLHESQHARPPCPSPTPGVHSDSGLTGDSSHLTRVNILSQHYAGDCVFFSVPQYCSKQMFFHLELFHHTQQNLNLDSLEPLPSTPYLLNITSRI